MPRDVRLNAAHAGFWRRGTKLMFEGRKKRYTLDGTPVVAQDITSSEHVTLTSTRL
jgi:hypothetical protein